MAKKITNAEKLEEAAKLINDVMVSEYGQLKQPKFINFEAMTLQQAQKKSWQVNQAIIKTSHKYGREFISITMPVIVDENKLAKLQKEEG